MIAITYRCDVHDPTKYNALYSLATDGRWRIGLDMDGEIARYDTAAEAEASAGHRLVALLRRSATAPSPVAPALQQAARNVTMPLYLLEEGDLARFKQAAIDCIDDAHRAELTHVVDMLSAEIEQRARPMLVVEPRRRKLYSLLTKDGTACAETVLTEEQYNNPTERAGMDDTARRSQFRDPPMPGTWTDVSGNDACQAVFQDDDAMPDGPPSRCAGACAGKTNAEQWNGDGLCNFCGEDGNV